MLDHSIGIYCKQNLYHERFEAAGTCSLTCTYMFVPTPEDCTAVASPSQLSPVLALDHEYNAQSRPEGLRLLIHRRADT